MTLAPMEQHGPFIPFEKPIPVPATDATEEPLRSVCFNEAWTPAVVGALKSLTRPETWEGTKADIDRVSRSAHAILASDGDGCQGVDPCPDFYAERWDWDTCNNTPGSNLVNIDLFAPCPVKTRAYWGYAKIFSGSATLSFRFRETAPPNVFCGGNIRSLGMSVVDGTVTPVWQLSWVDCFGFLHTQTSVTQFVGFSNVEAQSFCISALHAFAIGMSIDGPILCTSA